MNDKSVFPNSNNRAWNQLIAYLLLFLVIPSTSGSEQKNSTHYDIHQTESPSISLPGTEPYPSDLGIGSLVEVVLEHQVFYGVIRWIDIPDADGKP